VFQGLPPPVVWLIHLKMQLRKRPTGELCLFTSYSDQESATNGCKSNFPTTRGTAILLPLSDLRVCRKLIGGRQGGLRGARIRLGLGGNYEKMSYRGFLLE